MSFSPSLRPFAVLLALLFLSGCQNTRTAFQFTPPSSRHVALAPDSIPELSRATTLAAVPPVAQPSAATPDRRIAVRQRRAAHKRFHVLAAKLLVTSRQLRAQPAHQLTKQSVRKRTQGQTTAEITENGLGTMFIGIVGILVLLVGLVGLLVGGGAFFGVLAGIGALALAFSIVVPYLMGYAS